MNAGTGLIAIGAGVFAASAGIGGYAGYKLSDKKDRAIGTAVGAVAGSLVLPMVLFPLVILLIIAVSGGPK